MICTKRDLLRWSKAPFWCHQTKYIFLAPPTWCFTFLHHAHVKIWLMKTMNAVGASSFLPSSALSWCPQWWPPSTTFFLHILCVWRWPVPCRSPSVLFIPIAHLPELQGTLSHWFYILIFQEPFFSSFGHQFTWYKNNYCFSYDGDASNATWNIMFLIILLCASYLGN